MYLQTFILTSFKNIFHVSDRVRVHVCVIISSSLKPYQNFGPDLSPACLLMLSVVIMIKETDTFKTDHGYSIRSRASCQWSWRVKIYISDEKLSNSKYITALVAVCRNIIFNNERIIWGKHFASYYQDLFSNLYNMYQSFRIGHCLEILFFARLSKFRGNSGCLVTQSVSWFALHWLGKLNFMIRQFKSLGCWL